MDEQATYHPLVVLHDIEIVLDYSILGYGHNVCPSNSPSSSNNVCPSNSPSSSNNVYPSNSPSSSHREWFLECLRISLEDVIVDKDICVIFVQHKGIQNAIAN